MIDYFQIQRLASIKGMPEDVIEKDYFIELLLFYLSSAESLRQKFIFRGGTALKKIYFPEYRFSEDLDFIVDEKEILTDLEKLIDEIIIMISADYPFSPTKVSNIKNDRLQIFISYDVVPELKTVKELKIDILKDVFSPSSIEKEIIFTYPDFRDKKNTLSAYTLEAVVTDKISRIMDVDKEARDIFDLWFLLKLDYLNIFMLKDELKRRLGFKIHYPNLIEEIKSRVYKQTWEIRLEKQVTGLPSYGFVISELEELIINRLL